MQKAKDCGKLNFLVSRCFSASKISLELVGSAVLNNLQIQRAVTRALLKRVELEWIIGFLSLRVVIRLVEFVSNCHMMHASSDNNTQNNQTFLFFFVILFPFSNYSIFIFFSIVIFQTVRNTLLISLWYYQGMFIWVLSNNSWFIFYTVQFFSCAILSFIYELYMVDLLSCFYSKNVVYQCISTSINIRCFLESKKYFKY